MGARRRLRRRLDVALHQPLMVERVRSAVRLADGQEPIGVGLPLRRGAMRVELRAEHPRERRDQVQRSQHLFQVALQRVHIRASADHVDVFGEIELLERGDAQEIAAQPAIELIDRIKKVGRGRVNALLRSTRHA